jgi:hypothetical protein
VVGFSHCVRVNIVVEPVIIEGMPYMLSARELPKEIKLWAWEKVAVIRKAKTTSTMLMAWVSSIR